MWQDISRQEMFSLLLATALMLGGIIVCALLLISALALLRKVLGTLLDTGSTNTDDDN